MPVDWDTDATKARVQAAIGRGLVRAAEAIKTEAVRLVLETAKSGAFYKRGGVSHQASAPGEPPASDTGRLVGSIDTDYDDLANNRAFVVSGADYSAYLEFGTSRIAPRPFMRPAAENKRKAAADLFREEVEKEFPG